jgi:hypothetical protein
VTLCFVFLVMPAVIGRHRYEPSADVLLDLCIHHIVPAFLRYMSRRGEWRGTRKVPVRSRCKSYLSDRDTLVVFALTSIRVAGDAQEQGLRPGGRLGSAGMDGTFARDFGSAVR